MARRLARLLPDCDGAMVIEYALIAALIAAVLIVGVGALGTTLNSGFDEIKLAIIG